MLGLPPARLRAYVRSGLLSAEQGEHGRRRFSFQDLLLLRTAEGLVAERIPPRRVVRALKKLREHLTASAATPTATPRDQVRPLTGVPLSTDGDRIVAHDGAGALAAGVGAGVADLPRRAAPPRRPTTPIAPTRADRRSDDAGAGPDAATARRWRRRGLRRRPLPDRGHARGDRPGPRRAHLPSGAGARSRSRRRARQPGTPAARGGRAGRGRAPLPGHARRCAPTTRRRRSIWRSRSRTRVATTRRWSSTSARSPSTAETPTRTTTPPASTRRSASTPPQSATCAPTASSSASADCELRRPNALRPSDEPHRRT